MLRKISTTCPYSIQLIIAHFGWGKIAIRIQEFCGQGRVLADVWKRFAVGEGIDLRANFGLTQKRSFGASLKTHEVNYEGIPIIEELQQGNDTLEPWREQLKRRIICAKVGNAKLTKKEKDVNRREGVFLHRPVEYMSDFLDDPITGSLFMKEWCAEFFKANSAQHCAMLLNNLESIDPQLELGARWLAGKLSGAPDAHLEPPTVAKSNAYSVELVRIIHRGTPKIPLIRPYLLAQVDELPGLKYVSQSKKDKLTKAQTFDMELRKVGYLRLYQYNHTAKGYDNLLVDCYVKLNALVSE